jgi:hypothetical protein
MAAVGEPTKAGGTRGTRKRRGALSSGSRSKTPMLHAAWRHSRDPRQRLHRPRAVSTKPSGSDTRPPVVLNVESPRASQRISEHGARAAEAAYACRGHRGVKPGILVRSSTGAAIRLHHEAGHHAQPNEHRVRNRSSRRGRQRPLRARSSPSTSFEPCVASTTATRVARKQHICDPPRAGSVNDTSLGVRYLSTKSTRAIRLCWLTSPAPSALRVSHSLSGLHPPAPRGSVSRHIRP